VYLYLFIYKGVDGCLNIYTHLTFPFFNPPTQTSGELYTAHFHSPLDRSKFALFQHQSRQASFPEIRKRCFQQAGAATDAVVSPLFRGEAGGGVKKEGVKAGVAAAAAGGSVFAAVRFC
jgi:hypothetical protein